MFFDKRVKNIYVLSVPKMLWVGLTKFWEKEIHRGILNKKVGKNQEVSGMGRLKIFLSNTNNKACIYRIRHLKMRNMFQKFTDYWMSKSTNSNKNWTIYCSLKFMNTNFRWK